MTIASTLNRFNAHCAAYRSSVDRILCDDLSEACAFQRICRQIQLNATELQVDRHLILDLISRMRLALKSGPSLQPKQDVRREHDLRERLKRVVESLPVWSQFNWQNPLAKAAGLLSVEDYINSLQLHLPEIYEETLILEERASTLLQTRSRRIATEITIGLQHMGRNHISFLQPALDWLSDEENWDEI
jgi:hypothetical protein